MRASLVVGFVSIVLLSCSGSESPSSPVARTLTPTPSPTLSPTPSPTQPPASLPTGSPEDILLGIFAFVDQSTRAYFEVVLAPSLAEHGGFLIAIPDGGFFIPDAPATVTKHAPNTTLIDYAGSARFHRDPVFDPLVGLSFNYQMSLSEDSFETGQIRLSAIVDEIEGDAQVTLVFEGNMYKLNHQPPPQNVDQVLASVAAAMERADWEAAHAHLSEMMSSAFPLDEYQEAMDQVVAAFGPILSVEVMSSVTYYSPRTGLHYRASADIRLLQDDGATETVSWARARMVYERDAWRITTLDPPEMIGENEPPLPPPE